MKIIETTGQQVRFETVESKGRDYLVARRSSGGTWEILDIEVATERRKRIGHSLVEALLRWLPVDCPTVYVITRIDNEVAQQFYEKLQFDCCAVLRRFYRDSPFPRHASADAVMYARFPRGPI